VLNPEKPVIKGDKQSPLNKDFYTNLKAQGWWELRNRFYRTYRAVEEGAQYDPDTLISLDSGVKNLRKLEKELCQVTASKGARLKMLIDKTPEGTRSPNLADAVMMAYWPIARSYNLERFLRG
jgi:phage terminase large subunit